MRYRGAMADKNMCCCGARMSRLNEQHNWFKYERAWFSNE
jgi:hypothetical protein